MNKDKTDSNLTFKAKFGTNEITGNGLLNPTPEKTSFLSENILFTRAIAAL
jgi:hypothetical protein